MIQNMGLQGTHQLFVLILFAGVSSTLKECFKLNPSGGFDSFCCDNYVRIHGSCVECKPGTSSVNEKPCTPCARGRYGTNCRRYCNCKKNEKCESIGGCKLIYDMLTSKPKLSTLMSLSSNQHQTSEEIHEKQSPKATMKPQTYSAQHVFQTSQLLEQTSISLTEHTNVKGLSAREVLVYSLGSAAFFIICTVMCVAFICFHRGKTIPLIEHSISHSVNQINEDNNSCYSVYESIDEGAMYDDNVLNNDSEYSEDKYSNLDLESSTLNSENSGYLLPFTSMIPSHGTDEHPYCRDGNSTRGSNVSCLSDDKERDLKHINPYEQLHTELNKQSNAEYTHLHAAHYLELLDMGHGQNIAPDWYSSFGGSKHYLKEFRKWYSNDNISDKHLLCTTSKKNTTI